MRQQAAGVGLADRISYSPLILLRGKRIRCSRNKNIDVLAAYRCENDGLYGHLLRAEVVMLFAVERLSERSEDWPTNDSS